jgi:signal transduction histidine kinase
LREPNARLRIAAATSGRDYWMYQLGGWGVLTVMWVLSSAHGPLGPVLRMALAKVLVMASGFCLSHAWRRFLRRRGWIDRHGALPAARIGAGLAVCSVSQVGFLVLVDLLLRHGGLLDDPAGVVAANLLILFVLWAGVFLVWSLAYAVVLSRRRALRFELEKLELEVSAKDAELRALQAQVNPHFFFNSLNSIRALIYEDPNVAAQAVSQLAGLMRYSLRAGQAPTVRLADELAAVNAYLAMEKYRFEERLQAQVEIAPGLDEVAVPPMALQTLVENAVKHGVEHAPGSCQLHVAAGRDGDDVLLTVANQGRLAAASASTRLGLANTSKRLALLFGPRASCTLLEQDGWVTARVVLPQETA